MALKMLVTSGMLVLAAACGGGAAETQGQQATPVDENTSCDSTFASIADLPPRPEDPAEDDENPNRRTDEQRNQARGCGTTGPVQR